MTEYTSITSISRCTNPVVCKMVFPNGEEVKAGDICAGDVVEVRFDLEKKVAVALIKRMAKYD